MKNNPETIRICHCCQFAARAIIDDLTANPDLLNVPAYRELFERVYMAARQSAHLARILGDAETGDFTDKVCEQLIKLAKL